MKSAADRMKAMRDRRRTDNLRELRLMVPDARSPEVQRRVAASVARLSRADEDDALAWIESVSEFDEKSAEPIATASDPGRE